MARPRRIAVYGGSFDPPHLGHAMVAAWVLWTDHADAVWLLPTHTHAFGKAMAPWAQRVAACEALARRVGPGVSVCTLEGRLEGTSYTRRTLDTLAEAHPDCSFRLVLGADLLPTTPRWKDWDHIAAAYDPLVVGRAGYPPVPGRPTFPDVSSTAIREALQEGLDVSSWVPSEVLAAWEGRVTDRA